MVENTQAAPAKLGVENLKKVVLLICALAGIGDQIGHEKGTARWGKLLGLVGAVQNISGLKWDQVLPEIKDLDDAERGEIEEVFKANFDLVDAKLESVIEKGIVIAEKQVSVVKEATALIKELKSA